MWCGLLFEEKPSFLTRFRALVRKQNTINGRADRLISEQYN